MIHRNIHAKADSAMTGITSCGGGNMCRRHANGSHTIVAGFTLSGQYLKNRAHMTGYAINQIVVTFQRKTGNKMIKYGGINHQRIIGIGARCNR